MNHISLKLQMTRKRLSVLLISSALFVVGCGTRKNKTAQIQKETVSQSFVEKERAACKEDYSIEA